MPLITTPGASDANSFSTVDEFKAYRINRYPQVDAVLTASDAAIEAALIVSGRGMDAGFDWTGGAVDNVQAMTWPRLGMFTRNKFPISTTSIPQGLKDAQCEWAYQVLAGGDFVSDDDAAKKGLSRVKAGSVLLDFQQVDSSTFESVDMIIRRLGSEFNYLNAPAEVRRLLVDSWFNQPSIFRPLEFIVTGGSNGAC